MHPSAFGSTPISSNIVTASILPAKTADNNAFSWYDSPLGTLENQAHMLEKREIACACCRDQHCTSTLLRHFYRLLTLFCRWASRAHMMHCSERQLKSNSMR